MSRKKKPKQEPVSRMSMSALSITLTVNGQTHVRSLNYERIEHADGTVTERGLPAGMKPGATVRELLGHVLGQEKD